MGMSFHTKVRRAFTTDNLLAKILLAEFLGVFVLITIGDSSVAQNVLSLEGNGDFISINIAWGLAVSLGAWVAGGVSGGHINPAVTLALCIMGRCPWKQLPIYWIGQYLGALAGSAAVFGVYIQAIEAFDGGERQVYGVTTATAGIWATYPASYLTVWGGLGDQIVSTALLMMLILAITDDNNMKPSKGMLPFCVGLIVMAIGLSLGHNCGYAINPARDLGPRAFTAMAGWGMEVFTYPAADGIPWSWVPVVGPHIGAILGGWMYLIFVGNHIHDSDDNSDKTSDILELSSGHKQGHRPHSNEIRPDEIRHPQADYDHHNSRENLGYRGSPNRGFDDDIHM